MKRVLWTMMALILILGFAGCSSPGQEAKESATTKIAEPAPKATPTPVPAAEVVVFTDEVLELKVREVMKKPSGDITIAEAEMVESLVLKENNPGKPSPRIKDINALKYFKNLKGLDLSYNQIEDLAPLADLTKLEVLQYWGAESVKDFSALSELTNMLDLLIAGTQGEGIRFTNADMQNLAGMTNIEMIWIQGAKVLTDISVVAKFKKLCRLNIDFTGVSDISPVASIASLVEMDLTGAKVSNVSSLKNLVNLKKLYLKDCPITDYSPLKDIYQNLTEKDFELK